MNDSEQINNEEVSTTGGVGDKFVIKLHPGKANEIKNRCSQTLSKQSGTDKCIPNKMSTLESGKQGQTSPEREVTEPDDQHSTFAVYFFI